MADTLSTLADRLKNRDRDIDAIVDKASTGGTRPKVKKPKAKAKPKEKAGTGTSSFNLDGAIKTLRAKITATDDPNLKAKFEARIKALRANQ
jgi:hypothetical protein